MRSFGTVPVKNYIGAPMMQAANICKSGAMKIAPFTIPWAIYLLSTSVTQMGVLCDVQSINQVADFPQIRSIYIDNTGNNVPVWARFPDTGFIVACQPNAAGWFPVYTNGTICQLYGVGFTPNDFNSATSLFFSDTFIPPYVDNELLQSVGLMKASPTIQRGSNIYNSLYAAPALGDQTVQASVDAHTNFDVSMLPARATGFYYVTGICCTAFNFSNLTTNPSAYHCYFLSFGVSGILYDFGLVCPGNGQTLQYTQLFSQTGLQLKLDATEQWRFSNNSFAPVGQGGLELYVNYTYQP